MKNLIIFLLIILTAFLTAKLSVKSDPKEVCVTEVVNSSDTLTIHDTLFVIHPQPRDVVVIRHDTIRAKQISISDTLNMTSALIDTALVEIPIEQRHFVGEKYEAWVSGYRPSIDSIYIDAPTTIITNDVVRVKWRSHRWGVGATAGLTLTPRGIFPGLTIGLTYNFVTF